MSSDPTSLLPLVGGERLVLSELLHRLPDGETTPTSTFEARSPDVRLDTSLELLLDHSLPDGEPRVLATVVATSGSTYRKAGARMLILANGSYVGLLSGGCLEADLKEHADEVLRCGIPRVVEYDMRGPDDILFGIAAGCEGAMRILLEPAGRDTPADRAFPTAYAPV